MLSSCFVSIKFNLSETSNLAVGDVVDQGQQQVSAGGHRWWIRCYPRRDTEADSGEYVSINLQLVSKSRGVKATFEAFLMKRNGAPSSLHAERCGDVQDNAWGWPRFVKRGDLKPLYVVDGWVTIVCGVIVVGDDRPHTTVPTSDIGDHLGQLLDCADGSDVSLVVGGKTFAAHRAVLAARSLAIYW